MPVININQYLCPFLLSTETSNLKRYILFRSLNFGNKNKDGIEFYLLVYKKYIMANSMLLNQQRHFFRKTKSLTILLETPSIDVIRNYTAYCIDFFSQSKFKSGNSLTKQQFQFAYAVIFNCCYKGLLTLNCCYRKCSF